MLKSILFLILSAASVAHAKLPKGQPVLPEGGPGIYALELSNNSEMGGSQRSSDPKAGFKETLVLETKTEAANVWDVQAATRNAKAIRQGDVLLASFQGRALKSRIESGEAVSMLVFELARDPWEKSVERPVRMGKDWRQFYVPFKAVRDYAVGEAQLIFRMGYAPQAFEIAELSLVNYGSSARLEDMPVSKITYQGREADAPWRAKAQADIEKYRMGSIRVKVSDAKGAPLAGAKVSLRQTRNAFHFGTAISGDYLYNRNGKDDGRYVPEIKRLFNTVTEENAFKWPAQVGDWGPGFNKELALLSLTFAAENELFFRGHVLFWPSWRNSPKYLKDLAGDKVRLRKEVLKRVSEAAASTGVLAGHWDVINEPYDNHDITDILGEDILVDAFKAARKANSVAKLYLNDYAILAGGGGDSGHRKHFEATIKSLLSKGADLGGIGMQGHFGDNLTGMDDARQILDRFTALGPKISITEYDVTKDDLELAADYTRDILTLVYSHPACEGFVMWGFWDGAHWENGATLYKKDWTPKPALKSWEDLVLKAWLTQAQGMSDGQGAFGSRGHLGDYEVTVEWQGKVKTVNAKLERVDGLDLAVKF